MKDKLINHLWLMCLLIEAQEIIDEVVEAKIVRHKLKLTLNNFQKELDLFFKEPRVREFFNAEESYAGIEQITNILYKMRNELKTNINAHEQA